MPGFEIEPSLRRVLSSDEPPEGCDIELVTDDLLQVVIYFKVEHFDVAGPAWALALAVDRVCAWLDFYKYTHFRSVEQAFAAARVMLSGRKLKDRNKTPHRE